jgi:hypothetical protein
MRERVARAARDLNSFCSKEMEIPFGRLPLYVTTRPAISKGTPSPRNINLGLTRPFEYSATILTASGFEASGLTPFGIPFVT